MAASTDRFQNLLKLRSNAGILRAAAIATVESLNQGFA
jgi:hypothetical protein